MFYLPMTQIASDISFFSPFLSTKRGTVKLLNDTSQDTDLQNVQAHLNDNSCFQGGVTEG